MMKSAYADEVEACASVGLNPPIAAAISSERSEDFICEADLFRIYADLIAFAVRQMPHSHSLKLAL